MAASSLNLKSSHVRSISLPSKSHPLVPQFDECLCRLHSSEATSTSSSSIGHRLNGLKDLYGCVDSILQLLTIQKCCESEWLNELLDGLLRLLDVCTTAKDALSMTKNRVQELQSALRRRRGDESGLLSELEQYLRYRKKVKKEIQKAMSKFKGIEGRASFSPIKENRESAILFGMLKEVESVTFKTLESLLSFVMGQRSQSKSRSWTVMSKLIRPTRGACEETSEISEVQRVDAEFLHIMGQRTAASSCNVFGSALEALKDMEFIIQDLDEGVECVCRHMIKTRASLLNILHC